jgi:hypothetical protein
MKGEQEHEEHLTNTHDADCPPGRRGPSEGTDRAEKQPDLDGQLPQIIIGFPKRLKL